MNVSDEDESEQFVMGGLLGPGSQGDQWTLIPISELLIGCLFSGHYELGGKLVMTSFFLGGMSVM